MEKAQAKGEIAEEELRALEMDVTGKVRIINYPKSDTYFSTCRSCSLRGEVPGWRSFRSLREVLDNVLKEPGVPEEVLMNRAKVTLPALCGEHTLTDAVPRPCLSPARSSSRPFRMNPTKNAGSLSGRLFLASCEIPSY